MTTKTHNPADKVERWSIDKLFPYARNSRTHSDAQVAQIAASIKEWGWMTPVLVDETGSIIAGHGRTLAAQRLQMTEVPVMVAKGWSDAKKRAYIIADNKLAMNAGWDNEMLALELGELQGMDFDLDLTGFTADEIAALMPEHIPRYCDVIIKRWQDFTGKIATHAETGKPFAEVTHGNEKENTCRKTRS